MYGHTQLFKYFLLSVKNFLVPNSHTTYKIMSTSIAYTRDAARKTTPFLHII